jgi:hypothetical protein
MAIELREFNITSVSLWPGAVKSELFMDCGLLNKDHVSFDHTKACNDFSVALDYCDHISQVYNLFKDGESLDMAGKCVAALAADGNIMAKSGHILTDMELAKEYNLYEEDGSQPRDPLVVNHLDFIHQLNYVRGLVSL